MKLSGPFRGVFGNTSSEAIVWQRDHGAATVLARNAGGARLLRDDVPAWVQCKDGVPWGGGDPKTDYSLHMAAGAFDVTGGANDWTAGKGAYTADLFGALRWNAPVPVPSGLGCKDTDPETGYHVCAINRENRGLQIYAPTGEPIGLPWDIPISWARLRGGVLLVLSAGRVLLADVTPAGLSHVRTAATLFAPYQPHAVRYRTQTWLVYHVADEGRGLLNRLVAHPEDSFTGYVLTSPGVPTYGLDVRVFGDEIFVGCAANEGETFESGAIFAVPSSSPVDLRSVVTPHAPPPIDPPPPPQEPTTLKPTPQQIQHAVATAKQQTEAEGFAFPIIQSWDEPAKVRAMRVMVRATWALAQQFPQAEIGLEHYGGDSGAEFLGDKYSPDIIAVGKGGAGSVTYDVLVAGATPAAQLGAAVNPADWRPVINPSKLPPVGIDPPPDDGGDDDDDPPPVDAAPILQLLTEIRNEQRQLGEQVTAVVALQQQLGGALMDAKQDLDKALQKLDRSYAGSFRVLGTTVPITLAPKE